MKNMEVIKMEIEESKMNKGMFILVATTDNGSKFVIGSQNHNAIPYEQSWETDTLDGHKKNKRFGYS